MIFVSLMGSDYDHFGKEAHIDHPHNDTVKANRKLLWDVMKKNGFSPIRTEWWHFNYEAKNYGLKVLASNNILIMIFCYSCNISTSSISKYRS